MQAGRIDFLLRRIRDAGGQLDDPSVDHPKIKSLHTLGGDDRAATNEKV
jgi:hypothetical protein